MRKTLLTLVVAGLAAGPALADIGTVTLDLVINGETDDVIDVGPPAPGGTISYGFSLYASCTASGVDGSNNGVHGIFVDVLGSAMAGIAQVAATPDPTFMASYKPTMGHYGLGFDLFGGAGGTGGTGQIAGIGDAQQAPGSPPSAKNLNMTDAMTPNAPHANGLPPVLIATGTVKVLGTVGTRTVDTDGGATLWQATGGLVDPALIVDDTVTINILPEPTTLMLLAPALLALRRRR